MTIKLVQVKSFCALMQEPNHSITNTANRIYIDHTALSRQISALEKDLGMELFDRSEHKKIKPTKDAWDFYNKIILDFQGMDSILTNYAKDREAERKRQLNIAGLYVLLERMIPFVNELKKSHPEIEVSLFNISKEEAMQKLKTKEVDVVFYPGDVDEICPIEINRLKITEEINYWVFYKDHPLTKNRNEVITEEKISKYPFGILSGSSYSQKFARFIEKYKIKSPINLMYGTSKMIVQMIKNKMCVSILSGFFLTEEDKKNLVLIDSNNIFESHSYLYNLKNIEQKEILKEFIEIIEKNKESIFN